MIGAILLGASIAAIVGIFWEEIVEWLKICVEKIKKIVAGIWYGVKVFLSKVGENVSQISRHYSKEGDQWYVTQETRKISQNDVPMDILDKMRRSRAAETDITDEIEEKLELAG